MVVPCMLMLEGSGVGSNIGYLVLVITHNHPDLIVRAFC